MQVQTAKEVLKVKKAKEEESKKTVEEEKDETTVSGSYGISKGTGWKMSLN